MAADLYAKARRKYFLEVHDDNFNLRQAANFYDSSIRTEENCKLAVFQFDSAIDRYRAAVYNDKYALVKNEYYIRQDYKKAAELFENLVSTYPRSIRGADQINAGSSANANNSVNGGLSTHGTESAVKRF